jgi:hypothetical protein
VPCVLLLRARAPRPVRVLQAERHHRRVRARRGRLRRVREGLRLDRGAGDDPDPRRGSSGGGGFRGAGEHLPEGGEEAGVARGESVLVWSGRGRSASC